MKQKPDSNTKQGHSTNMLLYAVAPQPKLSTDAIALDGAVVSRGNGIGATSKPLRQVDIFCERLDKIFEDGYPTKAQIIDAYHKSNPNSLSKYMTYQEAKKKSLEVRWKTSKCGQENCWCLMIEPEHSIKDDDGEEIYIVGSGSISKEYAEYIVRLHNINIDFINLANIMTKAK